MSYIKYEVRIHDDGDKIWYLNDKCHREDGPAVELADGTNSWYLNGKLHREDGPAIEYTNGYKSWWLNNKRYTEDEFNVKMNAKNNTQDCSDRVIEVDGVEYILKKKD